MILVETTYMVKLVVPPVKLLPGKNSDKILQFLHHRPIFYVVSLYVMTKTNGRCLKE